MLLAIGVRSQRVQTAISFEIRVWSADRSTASSQQPLVHQEPRTQRPGCFSSEKDDAFLGGSFVFWRWFEIRNDESSVVDVGDGRGVRPRIERNEPEFQERTRERS